MAYKGITALIPVGSQGFTGTRNQSQAGPGHLIYTEGAELDGGLIRKDGGALVLVEVGQYTSIKTLLHMDNVAEGATTFLDNGFLVPSSTWTAVGGANTTLTDKKFGLSGLTLNGTTDWITSVSTGIILLDQEFTVHCWFKCAATTGTRRNLLGQIDSAGNVDSLSAGFYRDTGNHMVAILGQGTTQRTLTGTSIFTNLINANWNHMALVRDNSNPVSNQLRLFLNGVQEASLTVSGVINTSSALRAVGQIGALTTNPWQGLVDEVVVRIGIAMWTTGFIPPTKATPSYGGGAQRPLDTPLPIIAGTSWSPSTSANEDVIMLDSGAILSDPLRQGTFDTVGKEGLISTRDPPPYFCVGGGEAVGASRKLFLFSATNQAQVRSGSDVTSAFVDVTPPADWTGGGNFPTFGCLHNFRIFAGGNASDPHRIYFSSLDDHTNFLGTGADIGKAGTIAIYPGQGEKLVGAYSIRGALILWKYPVGVYTLITQDPDPANWQIEVLSRSVGGINADCIIQIENDLLYMDRSGSINSLQATTDFGDFNTANMSEIARMQPFMQDQVNRGKIHRSHAVYYANKRQAWFIVPRLNSDIPDLRIQIGLESPLNQQGQGIGPRFFMSRRDTASALWLRPANEDGVLKPAIGSEDGCIYLLDQEARNKYGLGYPIQFSTANTEMSYVDPSLSTKTKNGQFMEIVYEPEGEWDLLVDVFWDDRFIETIPFAMGGAGGILGNFVLDNDTLGQSGVREVRRRLTGSGRRFRMTCINDGVNQNVSIAEFHISFTVGDERTPE